MSRYFIFLWQLKSSNKRTIGELLRTYGSQIYSNHFCIPHPSFYPFSCTISKTWNRKNNVYTKLNVTPGVPLITRNEDISVPYASRAVRSTAESTKCQSDSLFESIRLALTLSVPLASLTSRCEIQSVAHLLHLLPLDVHCLPVSFLLQIRCLPQILALGTHLLRLWVQCGWRRIFLVTRFSNRYLWIPTARKPVLVTQAFLLAAHRHLVVHCRCFNHMNGHCRQDAF